jgi:hypothetical protein
MQDHDRKRTDAYKVLPNVLGLVGTQRYGMRRDRSISLLQVISHNKLPGTLCVKSIFCTASHKAIPFYMFQTSAARHRIQRNMCVLNE